MSLIVPYLNFKGNTEEAFNFYKSVFGGDFTSVQRFGDTPHAGDIPPGQSNKIMHLSLQVDKDTLLLGSDNLESMGMPPLVEGTNFSLSCHPESVEEGTMLFNALAAGGQVLMPFEKVFWGAHFGMLIDQFGIKWLFNVAEEGA
ncbi:PhnB protein [Anseongella ginsenosidimutans]|uniref:PhnB protein n=1 Tax=Anseongella ginsenosidimutans TaxID=496056 RepID=A0A4R3KWY3_9SPHI|nr:VOC family protein [Anseongella ginsenosidimutans]QEC53528.1 VOC family protein [Anseongella ginsenosidimutans]TCS88431.1 PhnB protein [Anseongella ginsenosidimutans]